MDENIQKDAPECCIVGIEERPCTICGTLTHFVEYCVEQPLCSQQCINKYYKKIYSGENYMSKEELIQKISDIKNSAWGYHIGKEVMGIPYDEFIEIMDSVLHYLKNPDSNNN